MGESFCDVCGERWGIPTPAHECKVVPPMRDTATLLELLEAEERYWYGELTEESGLIGPGAKRLRNHRFRLLEVIRFYREEASRAV